MIDITPADLDIVCEILKKYVPDSEVRAFGSRHKWTSKSYSDLDIAIVGNGKLDKNIFYAMQEAFEESNLTIRVDLVDWYTSSDEFLAIIEQGYTVIQEKTKDNKLPDGWEVKKLGDIIKLNYGKSLTANNRIIGDVPVYGSSGITGWHNQSLVNDTGIIVGRKGTIGAIYKSNAPFYPIDTVYYITNEDIKCDFNYLFYLLQTLNLHTLNQDSAVPGLNRDVAYRQELYLPSLDEQKEIAAILSSLDDKIELNQQINKTLEEMAQAIFKEWFIDFNFPDENGNPYRDSGGAMIDSELGQIPADWSVGKLCDYVILNKGKSYKSSELVDNGLPMINLKTFGRNGNFRHDGIKYFDGQYKDSHMVKSGDLVLSMTDVTQQAEIIGNPLIIPSYLGKAIISLDVSNVIPSSYLSRAYLYFLFKNKHFKEHIKGFSSGTTVLHLNKDGVFNYKFVLPPPELIEKIDVIFSSTIFSININDEKSIVIAKTRDILLPKLISGNLSMTNCIGNL